MTNHKFEKGQIYICEEDHETTIFHILCVKRGIVSYEYIALEDLDDNILGIGIHDNHSSFINMELDFIRMNKKDSNFYKKNVFEHIDKLKKKSVETIKKYVK